MVIACSDSRVDPQTIFGAVPGELFVVRNVAALVPRYSPDPGHHGTSAALEFGVKVLKVPPPRGARARAVRRREGDGLWPAAAGAGLHRLVGRDRQAGVRRRGGRAGGAARADRGRGRAPLARQSHDLPMDRRGGRRGPACPCRAIGSTSTLACWRRRAEAGSSRWIEGAGLSAAASSPTMTQSKR